MRKKSKKQNLDSVSDLLMIEIIETIQFLKQVRGGEIEGKDLRLRLNAAEFVFNKAIQFHDKYSWGKEKSTTKTSKEDSLEFISITDILKKNK